MKEEILEEIGAVVAAVWLLSVALILFLAPFVVISLVVMYLWGAL